MLKCKELCVFAPDSLGAFVRAGEPARRPKARDRILTGQVISGTAGEA